jgi:O-antigen/teichoic acid export membrane protein
MKANSLFGGVQFFNIIISIVKSKAMALFLGPIGFGISSLFITTIDFISGLSSFGLGTSAVKNISASNVTNDINKISSVIKVLRLLVWVTGLLGMIVTIIFSSFLSNIIFGDESKNIAIIWISLSILFNQLCNGQLAILQGLRRHKYLALANLFGNLIGLLLSVMFYYFYKLDGIVPAVISSSLATLLFSWYYSKKIKIKNNGVKFSNLKSEGLDMLKMGFAISTSSTIAMGCAFVIRIFIGNVGSLAQVGLFTAGYAIINSYVGLIFRAMATDYYPRLSAISSNLKDSHRLVNQQAELAILILGPILAVFIIFIKSLIWILYSDQFSGIEIMLYWAALGMYFKAASWAVAYIILTQGDSKLFFLNEFIANTYILVFNIIGYWIAGLEGLGISFLLGYVCYCIQILIIGKIKYFFKFGDDFIKIFTFQFLIGLLSFLLITLKSNNSYILSSILILLSLIHSYYLLNKRIDLTLSIKKIFKK